MNFESLMEKYQLESIERSVLEFLYNNRDGLKKIGIRKVAKENFTSTTTVYKLANKLGFTGYADMVHSLHTVFEQKKSEPVIERIDLNTYVDANRDKFSALITRYKTKQLMIVGFGLSLHIANYVNESFILRGYLSLANVHLQLISEQYRDDILLIVISESGSTPRLIEIIQTAQSNGLKVLSFVGRPNTPIGNMSNVGIPVGNFEPLSKNIKGPNMFFPSFLYVFEELIGSLD
ncbi:MAG: MurR/RpiR family transcriptional regulator [Bacilli bacterium]